MKSRKKELDVDFIGSSQPLTKTEEKIISNIIRSRSEKRIVTKNSKAKLRSIKKVTA